MSLTNLNCLVWLLVTFLGAMVFSNYTGHLMLSNNPFDALLLFGLIILMSAFILGSLFLMVVYYLHQERKQIARRC